MELALVLRELWARKRLLLAGVLVAAFAAWYSLYHVDSLLPPKFEARALQYSAASATVFVDWPISLAGDSFQQVDPLVGRTMIYANLMASPGMVDLIGEYAHIPGDQIWAAGPVDPNVQQAQAEPTAQKRNVQIAGEALPYKLNFYVDPLLPLIDFYTQAPSSAQAITLANAAVRALDTFVKRLQVGHHILPSGRIVIRQVGEPAAVVVDGGIKKKLGAAVFVAAFVAWCALVLISLRLSAYWRAAGVVTRRIQSSSDVRGIAPQSELDNWLSPDERTTSPNREPVRS